MSLIPKAKKDLRTMSALEAKAEKKRLKRETEELIAEMGQEDELKALPVVQAYVKEREDEERLEREQDIEKLLKLSGNGVKYFRYLIMTLQRFISLEDIPKKYQFEVDSSDKGISISIAGTDLYGAFKVIGIPKYDIHACKTIAVRIGDAVGKMEGNFRTTNEGIILADDNDLKILKEARKIR